MDWRCVFKVDISWMVLVLLAGSVVMSCTSPRPNESSFDPFFAPEADREDPSIWCSSATPEESSAGDAAVVLSPVSDAYWPGERWERGRSQLTAQWSPDFSHIVFGDAGRIFVVNAEGTDLRSLSGGFTRIALSDETREIDFSPALSPDGTRVAYATLRYATGYGYEHTWEIATQAIDGSDCRRVTANDLDDVSPSWSPDGSRLAFVSARFEHSRALRVFTIAADGSEEQAVAPDINAQPNPPVWSPDGSRVAFVGETWETVTLPVLNTYTRDHVMERWERSRIAREAIYVASADGSSFTKLDWADETDAAPRTRMGRSAIEEPEEVVTHFQWSPDGKRVAFVAHYYAEPDRLYVADVETAELRQILAFSTTMEAEQYLRIETGPHEDPAIRGIAWTPDGSEIRFEVSGSRLAGDTRIPDYRGYTVAADGSGTPLLLGQRDAPEHYLRWPGVLERSVPFPAERSRRHYRNWSNFSVGIGPTRIGVYTDSFSSRVRPEVEGWLLTLIGWEGSAERVLVRIDGNRLVAARPGPHDASSAAVAATAAAKATDATVQCSNHVVPRARTYPGLVRDCQVLLQISEALHGGRASHWTTDTTINQWPGVVVEGTPPRVRAIVSMPGAAIVFNGIIPPAIGELTELRVLDLSNHSYPGGPRLRGTIPSAISQLSKLRKLELSNNSFTGGIPPELGRLTNLEHLGLAGAFSAIRDERPIPVELSSLRNLKFLDLGHNRLTGGIPPELGNLVNLEELALQSNGLSSSIPPELGNLKMLRVLNLLEAGLNGTIPPELGRLSNLEILNLGLNWLTGPIPPELGKLTSLSYLRLDAHTFPRRGLTGPIPAELATLNKLAVLNLRSNRLEGHIPPGWGGQLQSVDFSFNLFSGCAPRELQHRREIHVDVPFCS